MPERRGSPAELIEKLGSLERAAQRSACEDALKRLGEDPSFQRELLRVLGGGTRRARFSSAFVLFRAGRVGLRLLPALLDALELEDGDLRWSAAHMLAMLGRAHGEVFPVLLYEARGSESALRRRMAVYVLRELGPEREETRALLLEALGDPEPSVRRAALSSLAKLVEPDARCLERTLSILGSDVDPRMRRIAAVVLPHLVASHPDLRDAARRALDAARGAPDVGLARAAEAALARLEPRAPRR